MKHLAIYLTVLILCITSAEAKVVLPNFFANGMVLQQQKEVKLWGKSSESNYVEIVTSWDNKKYKVAVSFGNWEIKVGTPKAGGPYWISFNDGEELKISDVLIGEVWLVSGQSNMEMPIQGFKDQPVSGSEQILKNATNDHIRLFRVLKEAKGDPVDNLRGRWQKSDSASVRLFSAVGYLFAVELQKKLNVPVAIIQSAWGGTGIESWMSKETLRAFEDKYPVKLSSSVQSKDRNAPSALFNGMINPLIGYQIKGVLWYQGERNHREPDLYGRMFPMMVNDWRKRWNIGEFPFYYVQLAPIESVKDGENISLSALFREMQFNSQFTIPNSAMSVTLDAGEQKVIHPANKSIVAQRLVAIAFNKTYGFKENLFSGPVYKSYKIDNEKMILDFDYAKNGLILKEEETKNFEIAGDNKQFYPAKAEIKNNQLILVSDKVKKPLAARYAFKMWVKGNLYNKEGFPASSFRTDDW